MAARAANHRAAGRPDGGEPGRGPDHRAPGAITIGLDELLADRGLTLTGLAELVGITVVNLSILKNGRARAIRFSTLAALCAELNCQPGDLLHYDPALPGTTSPQPAVEPE